MRDDAVYGITSEQIALFRKQGFIKLKSVLTAEQIGRFAGEITRQTLALNTQVKPFGERTTYDKAFLQVMNLWEHSERARELVFNARLARIAAELLEVKGVRLYHDQSLYKEPGGGITPAHADQYYWPLATDRTVTAWIPLQAVPLEMGPLAFFAGSQNESFGRDIEISDDSEQQIGQRMQQRGFNLVEMPFEMGEVSFHNGWVFHRAGSNFTARARSVMTIIYMDSEMLLKRPSNPMQHNDWERWCPGAKIGELIDTPKNPVLYARTS